MTPHAHRMSNPAPRAIIVDDSPSTSLVLEFMLEDLGFDVTSLHQPEQVLSHLASHHYDVMILDWMMPQIDGITLLPLMREHSEWSAMKIIMCTGRTGTNDKSNALEQGADWFLTKPVKMDTLRECLKALELL